MYCLRVFIVVLQELHGLLQCLPGLFGICIEMHVYTNLIGSCVSELHAHLCPYRNRLRLVLQEVHCLPTI